MARCSATRSRASRRARMASRVSAWRKAKRSGDSSTTSCASTSSLTSDEKRRLVVRRERLRAIRSRSVVPRPRRSMRPPALRRSVRQDAARPPLSRCAARARSRAGERATMPSWRTRSPATRSALSISSMKNGLPSVSSVQRVDERRAEGDLRAEDRLQHRRDVCDAERAQADLGSRSARDRSPRGAGASRGPISSLRNVRTRARFAAS